MAWTTPRTWTTEVPTPVQFNDHISQNFLALYHTKALQIEDAISNNSEVLEDLPGMSFRVRSGETWSFLGQSYFVTSAAADAQYTVIAPLGSTGHFGVLH